MIGDQIMDEAGKAALAQVQADLSGDILDDIAMYESGIGVPQNDERARYWRNK